jgi:hypothetical protein
MRLRICWRSYNQAVKWLSTLLLLVALCFSGIASAVPATGCCPEEACTVVQCVDLGCVQGVAPMAIATVSAGLPVRPGDIAAMATDPSLKSICKEIWTPPD